MDGTQRGERQSAQVEEHQGERDDQPGVRCEDQVAHDLGPRRRMGSVLEDVEHVTDAAALGYGSVSRVVVGCARSNPHPKTVARPVSGAPSHSGAASRRGEEAAYAATWSASSMNASSRPFERKPIV